MITDSQTNFVYIADTLQIKYPKFAELFVNDLKKSGIGFDFLRNTLDTWAVDYMPIQVSENKFVRFTYKPDYLISTKKWAKTITDVDSICRDLKIKTIKSDIIIDGGNISKWDNQIMMTSKVFEENKNISEKELIQQIQELLEIEKINFVPVEKGDWLGHIDGMARFIDTNKVIINDFSKQKTTEYIDLLTSLHNSGIDWEEFPFNPYNNKDSNDATGIYLNYLETEKFIFLPQFGLQTDVKALDCAKKIFKDKEIRPIMSNEPAKDNGILNCLTWNIKK